MFIANIFIANIFIGNQMLCINYIYRIVYIDKQNQICYIISIININFYQKRYFMLPVIIAIFVIAFIFGYPLVKITLKEKKCSSYVEAEIVSVKKEIRGIRRIHFYIPEISYTVNDKQYKHIQRKTRDEDEYYPGNKIWILYNPKNPHELYEDDHFARTAAKISAAVGLFIIIFLFVITIIF